MLKLMVMGCLVCGLGIAAACLTSSPSGAYGAPSGIAKYVGMARDTVLKTRDTFRDISAAVENATGMNDD